MPRSSSRTRTVCNTACKCIKKYLVANNDRTNVNVAGATAEVATLKEAVSKAGHGYRTFDSGSSV